MNHSSKAIFFVVGAAMLASCSTNGSSSSTIDPNQVISAAQQICKYVPTAETVIGIIGAGVPGLSTAGAIAKAICESLPAKGTVASPLNPPTVAGVPVRGHYLKSR